MIIAVIVFIAALIVGMPIAFVLGLFGTTHILAMGNAAFLNVLITRMFSGVNIISISCIPFFIMAGELMNGGGVTARMLAFLRESIGRFKGGLGYCTVAISAILAAILGSAQAVAALLCRVLGDGRAPLPQGSAYWGKLALYGLGLVVCVTLECMAAPVLLKAAAQFVL